MNFPLPFGLIFLFLLPLISKSQTRPPPNIDCNGVLISYKFQSRQKIRPFSTDPKSQPYSFKSTAFIVNQGNADVKDWSLLIEFQNKELLVSASNSVLNNNSPFPFNTSDSNLPASFSGFPNTDLKTAIETANDLTQIQAQIDFTGTFFGSPPPADPLPKSILLDDPLYICKLQGSNASSVSTCCTIDPKPNINNTRVINASDSEFLPRRKGDLSIYYDVLQAYGSSYLAQVEISNGDSLGRLDNWKLSFQWMRSEFISEMKGAYVNLIDQSTCILGPQGQFYKDLDFTKILTCAKNPEILDLPPTRFNDTTVGKIPFCCRNGTILPEAMDPSRSKSRFQMQVFKMPPDLNRTILVPPLNWKVVGGSLNPSYQCGQPIRVSPTLFPDPSGLDSNVAAIATWQVVCNISRPKAASPKCCVSFSAFYNDSVVPCKTCACGCTNVGRSCNASARAVLQPPEALLVPFENRTAMTRQFAAMKRYGLPNPMPCPDNCGVSVNWHINSDYRTGWSARMTMFNWGEESFADWFAAVDMGKKVFAGYEETYSFNGTGMDGMIFMQGLKDFNYLTGEVDGANPTRDPRVPGKQQSVISFTKKNGEGIDVVAGDGFPKRVFFNGEECALPDMIPTGLGVRRSGGVFFMFVLVALCVAAVNIL